MQNSDIFNLPAGPPELCFDKNEFSKKSFSVDEFLHKHRHDAGLEAMRDDLGIYLKVLRSAMIELINEDYADFVNLSSNLIGLDQSIGGIQIPLGQLKEEIIMVKMTLTETMTELSDCLAAKKTLREHLKSVHAVTKVQKSMQKLEDLLTNQLADDVNPTILERAAMEYVQIDFDIRFCKDLLREPYAQPQVDHLHRMLLRKIEDYFLATLATKNREKLERCLRIYCTLDSCKIAEDIVRLKVVAPYMHPIISEASLQNCPQGLLGIYTQVFDFVVARMDVLLALTTGATARIKGFDFMLNSYWFEVERRLETHMASIFAPGNPDQFYQKYEHTNEFLSKLEARVGSEDGVARLKANEQYRKFQTRWNLPVYFQIRFQEIGGQLETACSKPISQVVNASAVLGQPRLFPFSSTIECIDKCWSDGVFLSQLFHRFWKLTLQCLARVTAWVDECTAIAKWTNVEDVPVIDFFVWLYMDVEFMKNRLATILSNATAKLTAHLAEHSTLLEQCFSDSREALDDKRMTIRARIVKEILSTSAFNIKQVSDIPRLYRKTNRDIPSKPCSYVDQVLDPVRQFAAKYRDDIDPIVVGDILCNIFGSLNQQYYSAVDDVLTSVQRTEESLRRLKNLRDKSSTPTTISNSSSGALERLGMTDDDKIRLQLQVDVIYWTDEIKQLGVQTKQIAQLSELVNLVEESTKIRSSK